MPWGSRSTTQPLSALPDSAPRRPWGPAAAALVCVACLAPFADKAFCIDDPLFLWAAEQIQRHPLDPYGFTVNWYARPEPMAEVTKNPPLASYVLALAAAVLGWGETGLHLVFLLGAAGAAWGTYRLAEGLCARPLLATLAAILTPVFLVSSTNVMCDTMMLCWWVWAVVCWRRGLQRPLWLAIAVVLIILCALTKYFGVSLVPLLLAYTLAVRFSANRGSSHPKLLDQQGNQVATPLAGASGLSHTALGLVALVVPVAVLAAYQGLTRWQYGHGLLLDAFGFSFGTRGSFSEGWAAAHIGLAFIGGCFSSVTFYLPLLWTWRGLVAAAAAVAGLLVPVLLQGGFGSYPVSGEQGWDWLALGQTAFFLLGGLAVLALAAADLGRHRDADALLLFLWVAGTVVFAVGLNWGTNGRSLLPMAPAAGILVARRLGRGGGRLAWRQAWPLIPSAALALAVTAADYRQAEADRAAARAIAAACAGRPGTLWLEGHWGFQYYLQRQGGVHADVWNYHFREGDFLALPGNNYGIHYRPWPWEAFDLLALEQPGFPWLATWSKPRGAGFYLHYIGPFPFTFGPTAPVRYRVLQFLVPVNHDHEDAARTQSLSASRQKTEY
jgi:hypothetical protein